MQDPRADALIPRRGIRLSKCHLAWVRLDSSSSLGIEARTTAGRLIQRAGLAFASNALSGDHRRYLALGNQGFLLGDCQLTYGREKILEGYYTIHFWRGVFGSFVLRHINNLGYNRDPVFVPALRLHLEL